MQCRFREGISSHRCLPAFQNRFSGLGVVRGLSDFNFQLSQFLFFFFAHVLPLRHFLKLLYPNLAFVCSFWSRRQHCENAKPHGASVFAWPWASPWFVATAGWSRPCGNTWNGSTLPPNPVPRADAILVLSGGILGRIPPRSTVEVAEAGDGLLYGANLFRQGRAPQIICAVNVATGGLALRPAAEDIPNFSSSWVSRMIPSLGRQNPNTPTNTRRISNPLFQEKKFKTCCW